MLDINYIRQNLAAVKKALKKKHTEFNLDKVIKLDNERKDLLKRVEMLRAEQNVLAKKKEKNERAFEIKKMLRDLEPQLRENEEAYFEAASQLHNLPHQSVPSKEEGNKIEKESGRPPKFGFPVKDHVSLGKELDIIDIERATKISGSRFYFLKKEAVLLEFALINYLIEKLTKEGFIGLIPPALVQEKAMFGSGFFPAEKNEIYRVNPNEDNLYLVGTAEVPLAAYHSDETFREEELPKKYWGFSTCFRREAGSYGQDTRGIIRAHQFDKMEMFVFTNPQDSWKIFTELVEINEEIFEDLGLPYRLVNISGGELGAPNAKKIDTEVWIPSQNEYRELTSCSHDTDFQARRLNIKFQTEEGEKEFVHTLNDTALAIGRTMVALMENNQQKNGSIKIPKVLHKYLGFKEIKKS
ncbi:MAG TPA: serine--tRNA ligase [Patescibacteria group bacterium]|nr:serine--tRNA ligase [Patescibacteria group bacterium]